MANQLKGTSFGNSMIELKKVKEKDRNLLFNLNQAYLKEMTKYYPDEPDENGYYTYGYFDQYFVDKKRIAYFILSDNIIVGFCMLNPYSYFNEDVDYVLAEFTILPEYRGNHYAKETIELLFTLYHGNWEIKYNINNIIAKNLWTSATMKYNPIIKYLSPEEPVLIFEN